VRDLPRIAAGARHHEQLRNTIDVPEEGNLFFAGREGGKPDGLALV
jgi:hypothetical protein